MLSVSGFYVSNVACRWWDQFMSLPFPDQIALKMVAFVPGTVSTSNVLSASQGGRQGRNGEREAKPHPILGSMETDKHAFKVCVS